MAIFKSVEKSFKEIGRLRKGAPKPTDPRQGLADLKYFRADFRPDEADAAVAFKAAYGEQPTSINVRMAFNEIDRVFQTYFMVYNTGGLLGKAGLIDGEDGLFWLYLRSNKTGEIIVRDGKTRDGGLMPFDPAEPVYSYKSKKGDDVPVYAKPEGRLYVMVPELRRVAYMTLVTHSWYDCAKLTAQLEAIAEIAQRMGQTLPAVPLVLSRREEKISVAFDGYKRMITKSMLNLDVRQDWAQAQFDLLDKLQPGYALPAPASIPALPSGVSEDVADAAEEDDDMGWDTPADQTDTPEIPFVPVGHEEHEQAAEKQTQAPDPLLRPYKPEVLRTRLQVKAESMPNAKAGDSERAMVKKLLEEIFPFDGGLEKVWSGLEYLTGTGNITEVPAPMVAAMLKSWLSPVQVDGGGWAASPTAAKEFVSVVEETEKTQVF